MVHYGYINDKEYFGKWFNIGNHEKIKELSYTVIEEGICLPHRTTDSGKCGGGIVDDDKYIESSSLHFGFGVAYDYKKESVKYTAETVIYLGMFFSVWGHCLTDDVRRLWFLKTKIYEENFKDCKLIYIPMKGFNFSPNFIRLLELMGFDYRNFVPVTEITSFKRIILPDECFFTDGKQRYFTKEYRELISCVKNQIKGENNPLNDKLYFTYSHLTKKNKKQVGEEKIEEFFKQQGYRIIAPEEYSLDEQLKMLSDCKHFASTEGSCGHNMIFLPAGAEVILIPRAHYLTGYQLALNDVFDCKVSYVDCSFSIFANKQEPWHGPFFFYVSKNLYDFFGIDCAFDSEWWRKNFSDYKFYFYNSKITIKRDDNHLMPPEYYISSDKIEATKYIRYNYLLKIIYSIPRIMRKLLRKFKEKLLKSER